MSKKNSNFRNQRRKKKYEEYLRNIEEKILILDVSEEIFFLKDKFFFKCKFLINELSRIEKWRKEEIPGLNIDENMLKKIA